MAEAPAETTGDEKSRRGPRPPPPAGERLPETFPNPKPMSSANFSFLRMRGTFEAASDTRLWRMVIRQHENGLESPTRTVAARQSTFSMTTLSKEAVPSEPNRPIRTIASRASTGTRIFS